MTVSRETSVTTRASAGAGGFDYETIPGGYYDAAYRRGRGIQSKWHHLKFRRVIEEMEGQPRHLDVGCGPGTLVGLLDDRFTSTGIDISTTEIGYACREYGSESKHFFAVHARALPDDRRDYDIATVVEVIEHLSPADLDDVLRATLERLRPGGKLVVTTPNLHSAWPLVEMLVNRFGEVKYASQHINRFKPRRLRRLLEGLGLEDVRVHSYLALAPFAAPLGWRLSDILARFERGPLERAAGLLLLGTGIKPGDGPDSLAARRERRRRAADSRRRRRLRTLVAAAVLVLLSPVIYSYTSWMLQPTSLSFSVRSVEWVRSLPAGNWLVDEIEHGYYSFKAPKKGGPQLKALPAVGVPQPQPGGARAKRAAKAPRHAAAWPPRIKPVFAHPLPGEGVWKPTGPPIHGGPPVLVTTFRTELAYPRIVAYVAWLDHTRTALAFYPGRYEPPHAAVRGPMMVPYAERWRLLATFNGAFTYTDGWNGSADNGRMNEPLKDGNATLVGYRDGRVAIVKWSGGPNAGPSVAWARQSLLPIVWNGRLNPALDDSTKWGFTLGNAVRVWRTGVGIDRRGNLMVVAADAQTVITFAKILQHIGAVQAMQFDINPEWHTLITYTHHHGLVPTAVEPQPMQSTTRYLHPDDRDFFAVYRRLPGPVAVPLK